MRRILVSAFLFAFLGFGLAALPAAAQADAGNDGIDTNCNTDFFTSEEQARQYFADDGGSATRNVDDLDRNGDGIACNAGLTNTGGNGSQFPGGGSESGAVEDTDDAAAPAPVEGDTTSDDDSGTEGTDSGDVASDDTAADDDADEVAAEDTEELPAVGTGPVTGQGSTVLMTLIAAGALLCVSAGCGVRAKTRS